MPSNYRLEISIAAALAGLGLLSAASRPRQSVKPSVAKTGAVTAEDTLADWHNVLHGPPKAEDSDADLGRDATWPVQIPPRGWWQITKRVVQQVSDHRVMTEAAGVTFYSLLAIFPALGALISLYGLVADPATVSVQLNAISEFLPAGGMDILQDQLKRLTSTHNATLSFGAITGLLFALWSANGGTKSLFDALNVVYDEKEKRSYFRRTILSLGLTLSGLMFLVIAMAAVVALPVALNYLGLTVIGDAVLRFARWPILLVIISMLLAVLYRYGPSRTEARWRWVTWGGALASVLWVLISVAFSWYVANFGSYNKTYGSLGAAVGFMTWIWISSIVVLVGAEIDAEMEHQTRRDTTRGPDKPLGTRGATKADHVA
jgi:membrane protein